MANAAPIFQAQPSNGSPATIVNADGTAEKTLYTAGANGALVDSVYITSSDTSAVILDVLINDGTASYLIGAINIPTLSGTDGVASAVNLLGGSNIPALQASGALALSPLHSLRVSAQAAVTATFTVTMVAAGGDY